jgi:hypothetical protein
MEEIRPLLDTLTQAGPYALALVFAYLWRLERAERLETQERERDLSKDYLKSTVRQTNSIRSLRSIFLHGRAPEPSEYEAEDVD